MLRRTGGVTRTRFGRKGGGAGRRARCRFHPLDLPGSRSLGVGPGHGVGPTAGRLGRPELAGARALAGALRDAVETHQQRVVTAVVRGKSCPFDPHALLPVPDHLLRRGLTPDKHCLVAAALGRGASLA